MRSWIRSCFALLALSFVTACGGGGTGTLPASGSPAGGARGNAAMTIFIPSAAPVTSAAKHASALPSTTQSVEIVVSSGTSTPLNPPVAPFVFNVGSTSPGCSSVSGGISCTESVTVPFGSLIFTIVAFSGQNASGAAIAEGTASATIGSATTGVSVTMTSANVYAGVPLEGGLGYITIDHGASTFAVASGNTNTGVTGTISTLQNGDLKLVVTGSNDPSSAIGAINYAREVPGSLLLFASTGSTSVASTGGVTSGGDMGAGVGLQGCPTSGSTNTVSLADVGGPAWNTTPTTSRAYTSGTAAISVTGGTASINFNGYDYSTSGAQLAAQGGTQSCSSGVFSGANQGSVAISPDGVIVVGTSSGSASPTDTHEGSYGFEQSATAGPVDVAAVAAGTYDGFAGGFGFVGTSVVKGEQPFQLQPLSSSSMQACPYTNFEGNDVGTSSCIIITFGSQTQQPGVVLVTATMPNQPSAAGAVVVGQTSNGKYAIFGNIGGTTVEFLQH